MDSTTEGEEADGQAVDWWSWSWLVGFKGQKREGLTENGGEDNKICDGLDGES